MSGDDRADGASPDYPDVRHGARGEPQGLPHYTPDDLERIAEQKAAEDEALGRREPKPSFWKRLFGKH